MALNYRVSSREITPGPIFKCHWNSTPSYLFVLLNLTVTNFRREIQEPGWDCTCNSVVMTLIRLPHHWEDVRRITATTNCWSRNIIFNLDWMYPVVRATPALAIPCRGWHAQWFLRLCTYLPPSSAQNQGVKIHARNLADCVYIMAWT